MSEQREVTILMAVYNGKAFLAEQLESIISQTYTCWKLILRDDQSSDSSLPLILEYVQRDPRISLITYGALHGSACENFSDLSNWALEHTDGLIMFADQDDIWEDHKIEVSVAEMGEMESLYSLETPLLCYTDFQFINEDGEQLPQRLKLPHELALRVLLNENYAWGCTMILNHALLKLVVPIPADAVNHDYWIALVASALGKTKLISQPLLRYRQHNANVSGNVGNMTFASRFNRYFVNQSYMTGPLSANLKTVDTFFCRYGTSLTAGDRKMVGRFIAAFQQGFFLLLYTMFKYRIFKIGLAKNVAYFYTLFLLRSRVLSQTQIKSIHEDPLR